VNARALAAWAKAGEEERALHGEDEESAHLVLRRLGGVADERHEAAALGARELPALQQLVLELVELVRLALLQRQARSVAPARELAESAHLDGGKDGLACSLASALRARARVRGRGRETNPQNVAVGGETALALEELGHGVDRRKQVAVRARARACDGRQSRHRGA